MQQPSIEKLNCALERLIISRDDDKAWEDLYLATRPLIHATIYRQVHGNISLTEDLTHEVFIKIIQSVSFEKFVINGMPDPNFFRGYLYAISKNVVISYFRGAAKRQEVDIDVLDEIPMHTEVGAELEEIISGMLKVANETDKKLIFLTLEGFSSSQIGAATGLSVSAVGVRLHRLRKKMREKMKRENEEEK